MSTTLTVSRPEGFEIHKNDVEWLFEQIQKSQGDIVDHICRVASCVARLDEIVEESNGAFAEELAFKIQSIPGIKYFRLIASGRLSARLYETFHSRPNVLERLIMQPDSVQRRFEENDPIPVHSESGDHRLVKPSMMRTKELQVVLDPDGGIRPKERQVMFLKELASLTSKSPERERAAITTDKKRGGIMVQEPGFISKAELVNILSNL